MSFSPQHHTVTTSWVAQVWMAWAEMVRQAVDEPKPCGHASAAGVADAEAPAAVGLGLHASIPVLAGSGAPIAGLNLYSHDLLAMAPLNAWVWAVYTTEPAAPPMDDKLLVDTGGADLVAGLIEAFEARALIQPAIGVVMAGQRCSPDDAYLTLRVRAAQAGTSLTGVATALQPHLPRPGGESHP